MSTWADVLRAAMQAAAENRVDEALDTLRGAIARAEAAGEFSWAAQFARSAGVLCDRRGLLHEAIDHFRNVARHTPTDAGIDLMLGDLELRLGNAASARLCFERCRTKATDGGALEIAEIATARLDGLAR